MRRLIVVVLCAVAAGAALASSGCGQGGEEPASAMPKSLRGKVEVANFEGVNRTAAVVNLSINNLTEEEFFAMGGVQQFENLEGDGPPRMQIQINSNGSLDGREVDFNGYVTIVPDEAMVVYGPSFVEKQYDIREAEFQQLESKFEEALDAKGGGGPLACFEAAGALDLGRLVTQLVNEGPGKDRYGKHAIWISGKIDVAGVLDGWIALAENPACAAQLRAVGSPPISELEAARKTLVGRVEEPKVLVGLGKNGLLRSLSASATVTNAEKEEISLAFEFRLFEESPFDIALAEGGGSFDALLRLYGTDSESALAAGAEEITNAFLKAFAQELTGRR